MIVSPYNRNASLAYLLLISRIETRPLLSVPIFPVEGRQRYF